MNDKCFQCIVNLYFILIFYHGFMIYIYIFDKSERQYINKTGRGPKGYRMIMKEKQEKDQKHTGSIQTTQKNQKKGGREHTNPSFRRQPLQETYK